MLCSGISSNFARWYNPFHVFLHIPTFFFQRLHPSTCSLLKYKTQHTSMIFHLVVWWLTLSPIILSGMIDFQPCFLKQSNHSDQGGSYILRLQMDICLFLNCHTHHGYSAFSHPSEQAPSASFYPLVLWFSSGQTWRPLPTELPHLSVSSLLAPRKPSIWSKLSSWIW